MARSFMTDASRTISIHHDLFTGNPLVCLFTCLFSIFRHIQQLFSYKYDGGQFFIGGRENPDILYNVFGKTPPTFRK
jgi:hypothetical protein